LDDDRPDLWALDSGSGTRWGAKAAKIFAQNAGKLMPAPELSTDKNQ
jgi:hypothetical protein